MTLRAIYSQDVKDAEVSIFVFNPESGNFESGDYFYSFGIVMNDPSWQVYVTDGDLVYPIENLNPVPEEQIHHISRPSKNRNNGQSATKE